MVFDSVVSSARKKLGDLSPPISELFVTFSKNPFFFLLPHSLLDTGVKLVVPTLTALLAVASFEMGADLQYVANNIMRGIIVLQFSHIERKANVNKKGQ